MSDPVDKKKLTLLLSTLYLPLRFLQLLNIRKSTYYHIRQSPTVPSVLNLRICCCQQAYLGEEDLLLCTIYPLFLQREKVTAGGIPTEVQ